MTLLPRWSDEHIAAALGLDRASDFQNAERETPECIAAVTPGDISSWIDADPDRLAVATRSGEWQGTANRLSPDRVEWPIIDEVAAATRYPGLTVVPSPVPGPVQSDRPSISHVTARDVILRRRSAVTFDGQSGLRLSSLVSMLRRLVPGTPPWDAIAWPPQVHLIVFVHRVEGLLPGIYAYLREPRVLDEWRAAMRPEFLWERVQEPDDLFLLAPLDVRLAANRLSCDQDIAADGFFSLGMLARFEASLREHGEWFYRRLFWECGAIGQVLYLEAEAIGARATGIGCFYDDPVHDALGLSGRAWQSLYHFSMGMPVEDARLTTEPGYKWEAGTNL